MSERNRQLMNRFNLLCLFPPFTFYLRLLFLFLFSSSFSFWIDGEIPQPAIFWGWGGPLLHDGQLPPPAATEGPQGSRILQVSPSHSPSPNQGPSSSRPPAAPTRPFIRPPTSTASCAGVPPAKRATRGTGTSLCPPVLPSTSNPLSPATLTTQVTCPPQSWITLSSDLATKRDQGISSSTSISGPGCGVVWMSALKDAILIPSTHSLRPTVAGLLGFCFLVPIF